MMDSITKIKRAPNPREKANLLSILSFFFTFKIIRKGARKDLKEDDIYEILNDMRSEKLGDELERLWKNELLKPNPSLIRPVFKMFGLQYIAVWISIFIVEMLVIAFKPILTGKIVSYFEPNTEMSKNEVLFYIVCLVLLIFLFTTYDPTFLVLLQTISMKIRIAFSSLLYRKCLKLKLGSSTQFASGTMITLITKDLIQINNAIDSVLFTVNVIIYLIIVSIIMYRAIGVASLAGSAVIFLLLPAQLYLGRKAAFFKLKTLHNTDKRVGLTQEIFTAIRIIKMYTWELFFSHSLKKLRKEEVKSLRCLLYVKAFALSIGELSSRVAFYICVIAYLSLGNHITAEDAYIVVGGFKTVDMMLCEALPAGITQMAEMKTSINRIISFLQLDEITPKECDPELLKTPQILVQNVTLRIEDDVEVLKNINIEVKQGLTAIIGNVGSGKSTLLKLLLNDSKIDCGLVEVSGKISYASQEPWLFPATVKQNIIFGESFDQERYSRVVQVCALEKDFLSLHRGDQTHLVDKGLNLSRGQKTRINLARAIYRKADIYLLDDCLSAVDAHVGKHIFQECIKKFLKGKICVFVTHTDDIFKEVDNIIILNNGVIEYQGAYKDIESNDVVINVEKHETLQEAQMEIENTEPPKYLDDDEESSLLLNKDEKNIYSELKQEGAVKKEVYYELFKQGGGIKVAAIVLFLAIMAQFTASWSDYFVSLWVNTEQNMSGFRINQTTESIEFKQLEDSHDAIMTQYSLVILGAAIFTMLRSFSFYFFFSKVSMNIHTLILDKIMNARMLFFDKNLSGNVVNRFSRDLGILDEQMPQVVFEVLRTTLEICGIFLVISSINLYFIVPSLIFAILLYLARLFYIPTGRSIKRLEGITRSPIVGHLNATFEGLVTIRASEAQNVLKHEFDQHQNYYNSVAYMNWSTIYAFNLYINLIATIYTATILLIFLFMRTDSQAGEIGLAITQSFGLTGLLKWIFRKWAELENQMTSAERVLEYTKIDTEQTKGDKAKDWSLHGKIVYKEVGLQYSPTSERVLKDITFAIEQKAKVGVVGRTGAGKSSIIGCLFKMYEFQGLISIDDKDINTLDTVELRSKISIIPQDPVLFSGTIRSNLDPKQEYDDKELWFALEEVEMKSVIDDLNSTVSDGGLNYSIGQRQLICLARAILRKTSILILDEATANIDPQTDNLIQKTVRKRFPDCTIITVAHRLNTIMDSDKVIVMDSGMVVEYDSPRILLQNKRGLFFKMVQEAGLL